MILFTMTFEAVLCMESKGGTMLLNRIICRIFTCLMVMVALSSHVVIHCFHPVLVPSNLRR